MNVSKKPRCADGGRQYAVKNVTAGWSMHQRGKITGFNWSDLFRGDMTTWRGSRIVSPHCTIITHRALITQIETEISDVHII